MFMMAQYCVPSIRRAQAEIATAAGLAADELSELGRVARGDPTQEREIAVGVGEPCAEFAADDKRRDRLGRLG